jgi:hypothetical protein
VSRLRFELVGFQIQVERYTKWDKEWTQMRRERTLDKALFGNTSQPKCQYAMITMKHTYSDTKEPHCVHQASWLERFVRVLLSFMRCPDLGQETYYTDGSLLWFFSVLPGKC